MTKRDIIQRLNTLNFDKKEYWLIAGSALVLYGIREETRDIDLGCSRKLADVPEYHGFPVEHLPDGTRKITCGNDIEFFENWLYDSIQIVEGLPVISLRGLLEMKKYLGREKDFQDIQLLKNFLEKNRQFI